MATISKRKATEAALNAVCDAESTSDRETAPKRAVMSDPQPQPPQQQQQQQPMKKFKLSGNPDDVTAVAAMNFVLCLRGDGVVGWKAESRFATPDGDIDDDEDPTIEAKGVFQPHFGWKMIELTMKDTLGAFTTQAVDSLLMKTELPNPEPVSYDQCETKLAR
jgi:hypothetical protein